MLHNDIYLQCSIIHSYVYYRWFTHYLKECIVNLQKEHKQYYSTNVYCDSTERSSPLVNMKIILSLSVQITHDYIMCKWHYDGSFLIPWRTYWFKYSGCKNETRIFVPRGWCQLIVELNLEHNLCWKINCSMDVKDNLKHSQSAPITNGGLNRYNISPDVVQWLYTCFCLDNSWYTARLMLNNNQFNSFIS